MSVRVGFGQASLWGTWDAGSQVLADEVAVQAMVLIGQGRPPMVVIGADFCCVWPGIALKLRRAVADTAHTTPDQVGVFNTQNHGLPIVDDSVYDLDQLIARYVNATRAAMAGARPAAWCYLESNPDPSPAINRRKLVPSVGAFTFYFGYHRRPDGRAGCRDRLVRAFEGLARGDQTAMPYPSPIPDDAPPPCIDLPELGEDDTIMDGPTDAMIQGLFFQTLDGQPIGTLARWAAHPAAATGMTGSLGGDYPVYLRRHLAGHFGGQALFLTGPCGNQCPIIDRKSIQLAQTIGQSIAGQLLDQLPDAHWQPLTHCAAAGDDVNLPLANDIPASLDDADRAWQKAKDDLSACRQRTTNLAELKKLADRVERLGYFARGNQTQWTGLTHDMLTADHVTHPLFALRIGSVILAGLPGEPLNGYSLKLRRRFADTAIITAEECNGYLGYIPTTEDFPHGGYEVCATIFDPRVESTLLNAMTSLIAHLRKTT